MGNRNVVVGLAVVFVMVLAWNLLYFSGVVGDFAGDSSTLGPTQPAPDSQFAIPNMPGTNRRPFASTDFSGGQVATAPVAPRGGVTAADISIGSNWGRNPFLTPREIWAVENYSVAPLAAETPIPGGGLQLSAVLGDSSGRRMAVINGNVVGIGDVVAGMEVIDVWEDAVVFRIGSERHVLRMNDAAVRLTVRGDGAGGQ
jgi:hypothetical protein